MPSLKYLIPCALVLTSLFTFPARAGGQSLETKSKGAGSITGHVTIDGKDATGITVAALGDDRLSSRHAAAQTTTDNEGRYHLSGLAAAQYQVMALAPNLVNAEQSFDMSSYYSAGKAIFLSADENVDNVDLKLVRGAVITGKISNAEGKPVIGERINLEPVDANGAPARQIIEYLSPNLQMYQTDDRGVYRIYGLAAGRYKVSVGSAPNSTGRSRYPQTFYPDADDSSRAGIVGVSVGSEAENIDISLGTRREIYSVSGRVVDSVSGQPVPGVRALYKMVSKTQTGSSGYSGGLPTNSKGEFRIEGLASGDYEILVSSRFDGGKFYSEPVYFQVADRDVNDIEIRALQGESISGRIMPDAETNATVLTKFAGLVIGASVRSESQPQNHNAGWAQVAADGTFQIQGLSPGKASMFLYSVTNPNDRGFVIARIERDGVDVTKTLEIQPGKSLSDIRVFVSYGTGKIRGTVKFENGMPPPGARIFVGVRREGSPYPELPGTQVDSRGHFLLSNLAPGAYSVTLNLAFDTAPPPGQRPLPPVKQFVTVADGVEAEVVLTVDFKLAEGHP